MDSASSGAVQYLKTLPAVTALVGSFPANDPVPANQNQPWIFHVGQGGEFLGRMEGTSQSAIVCSYAGSFSAGNPGSTVIYERLSVEFWVDIIRDANNNTTETSGVTYRRAHDLWETVDSYLHRRDMGQVQVWGEVVTVGSVRMAQPTFILVPDGDGLMRGQAMYGVSLFGHLTSAV